MSLDEDTLESLKNVLPSNVYKMFIEMDVLDNVTKADLEILPLITNTPDPEIVTVVCLNKLPLCIEKLKDVGYVFTDEEKEMIN